MLELKNFSLKQFHKNYLKPFHNKPTIVSPINSCVQPITARKKVRYRINAHNHKNISGTFLLIETKKPSQIPKDFGTVIVNGV